MALEAPMVAVRPVDNSLAAHLQALDALSHRMEGLTSRTRWPARIPLNGRASIKGSIVHTNELKVDIGAGYWIEMTAKEAQEYVQRRKTALLLQHAGLRENPPKANPNSILHNSPKEAVTVSFNPLFAYPAAAGPSRSSATQTTEARSADPARDAENAATVSPIPSPSTDPASKSRSIAPPSSTATTLEDVVDRFLQSQGMADIKNQRQRDGEGPADDAMINEEGLPIREIREDLNGLLIGDAPEPTTDGTYVSEEADNDYWSEDAKARRTALRNRLFGDGDSDLELSDGEDSLPKGTAAREDADEAASTTATSPIVPARSGSFSGSHPPRSILKATPARKKSVTFDESVPIPPDSPPPAGPGKMGFKLPAEDFTPRPVPVIAAPIPSTKQSTGGFGGFKRGFLNPHTDTPPVSDSPDPLASMQKRPSLFAQRMAAQEHPRIEEATIEEVEDVNQPPVKNGTVERPMTAPALPKMSDTKPMTSMKNAVIEREPAPVLNSRSTMARGRLNAKNNGDEDFDGSDDDENDGYDDDYDEEEEEEEEDEYDLDEALLAREIALNYHRKQGYLSKATRGADSDEEQLAEDVEGMRQEMTLEEDGQGGVMMALPQISSEGQIVNPTPDDLRKFVRVGRLENGNLVLAPGEEGWSDEEDEIKRARREAAKQQLLGSGPTVIEEPEEVVPKKDLPRRVQSLPPTVATDPIGEVKENSREETKMEETIEPPKKVSRFKAARMGM